MRPKHIKEQRDKEVRRIYKRFSQIHKENQALGYIELQKPIRHGWFKEIVITHKIERYKNEAAILEVFNCIEKIFWGRTKAEAQKKWEEQISRCLIYRDFPTISKKQFNELSLKAQSLCTPFYYKVRYEGNKYKQKLRFYIRIPKQAYKIKYTRAYITHSKRIDPLLESESALLQQQLLKHGYYQVNQKSYGWKNWDLSERKKQDLKTKCFLRQFKNYDLINILKEDILW